MQIDVFKTDDLNDVSFPSSTSPIATVEFFGEAIDLISTDVQDNCDEAKLYRFIARERMLPYNFFDGQFFKPSNR